MLLQVHDDGFLHLVAGSPHPEADDVERNGGHDLEHRQFPQPPLDILNPLEILVNLRRVLWADRSLESSHLVGHLVENAAVPLAPGATAGRVRP